MSDTIQIEVQARAKSAKSALRKLRAQSLVPAIVYGDAKDATPIAVPQMALLKLYQSGRMLSTPLELKLNGSHERVIARDVQLDAVQDTPVHADFLRLGKGTKIILDIPVRFLNSEESPGIRRGGVLNIVRHAVELRCPAEALPDYITIDLTGSDIGDSFHISGVSLPQGVAPTITRDFTIATIAAPTKIEEPVAAEPEADEELAEGEEAEAKPDGESDEAGDSKAEAPKAQSDTDKQDNKKD